MNLFTERLILRPVVPSDIPVLIEMLSDWQVAQWLMVPPYPYTEEDGHTFCKLCAENHALPSPTLYGIATKEALIGSVELSPSAQGEFGVGYWMGRRHWSQGYARESLAAISAYARDSLAATRLFALIDPENEPSRKLLTHAGFTFEGLQSTDHATRRGCKELHRYFSLL